jgi:hypothetical protein
MSSNTVTAKPSMEIMVPSPVNFLFVKDSDTKLALHELDENTLLEIGKKYGEALVTRAREQRADVVEARRRG